MRAVLSHQPGGPETLEVADIAPPSAAPGQVVVDVKAIGVNYPDALIIADLYQVKPQRPFSPGAELAGIVSEVGEGVEHLSVGDRVLAVPGHGAMVEQIAVDANTCIPIPDEMPFERGAAFLLTYGTSYYALKQRAAAAAGESIFILGAAGGVGLAAVQLAKSMGLTVIAGCSSQDKADLCADHGADMTLVYPRQPLDRDTQKGLSAQLKEMSGGGIDIVYDAVGGDYTEAALRALRWNGRLLVVGFPAGIANLPLNLTLLKSVSVVGVFWGAMTQAEPAVHQSNVAELFDLYVAGHISPFVSDTFSLDNAADAIQLLIERKATGKVVVVP